MLVFKLGNVIYGTVQHQTLHGGLTKCSHLSSGLGKAVNLVDSSGTSGLNAFAKVIRSLSSSIFVQPSFSHAQPPISVLSGVQSHRSVHALARFQSPGFKTSTISLKTTPIALPINSSHTAPFHSSSTDSGRDSTESDAAHRYTWIDEVSIHQSCEKRWRAPKDND